MEMRRMPRWVVLSLVVWAALSTTSNSTQTTHLSRRRASTSTNTRRLEGVVRCKSDSDCCAAASCVFDPEGQGLDKYCERPDGEPCSPCPFGFRYRLGLCEPIEFPCRNNPCPGGQRCVFEPKICVGCVHSTKLCVHKHCKQYRCVPRREACLPKERYELRTATCISEVPSPVDPRECRSCVFCVQSIPVCDPPCVKGYSCRVTPQTCHHCASAKCQRDRPAINADLPDYEIEPDEELRASAEFLRSQLKVPHWAQSPCVSCVDILPRCPRCPPGTRCVRTRRTCQHCPVTKCISEDPLPPC